MSSDESRYIEILQLNNRKEALNVKKLRKAFTAQSLRLHPDKNPTIDTSEDFILLTEAYNYYQSLLEAESYKNPTNSKKRKAYTQNSQFFHKYNDLGSKSRFREFNYVSGDIHTKYYQKINAASKQPLINEKTNKTMPERHRKYLDEWLEIRETVVAKAN